MAPLRDGESGGQIRPFIDNTGEASTVPARYPGPVHGRITARHLHTDSKVVGGIIV
jgi:hypothetical protein